MRHLVHLAIEEARSPTLPFLAMGALCSKKPYKEFSLQCIQCHNVYRGVAQLNIGEVLVLLLNKLVLYRFHERALG